MLRLIVIFTGLQGWLDNMLNMFLGPGSGSCSPQETRLPFFITELLIKEALYLLTQIPDANVL